MVEIIALTVALGLSNVVGAGDKVGDWVGFSEGDFGVVNGVIFS
jgi:hypothetical protein